MGLLLGDEKNENNREEIPPEVLLEIAEDTPELYRRFRPTSFKNVLGQEEAVAQLNNFIREGRIPHAILFSGPSGTGKTTLARIMRGKMGCADADFFPINAAEKRGIDSMREIMHVMNIRPLCGPCKLWLIDEAHKLTDDAQGSLLQALENTPKHVYFMLATTHPHKLRDAVLTRCTHLRLKPLEPEPLKNVVLRVAQLESKQIDERVLKELLIVADGSARLIVVSWDRIKGLSSVEEQLKALAVGLDTERTAYELVQLMTKRGTKWSEIAKVISFLREKEGENVEDLRCMILKSATSTLLSPKAAVFNPTAYHVLTCFEDRTYWNGTSGWGSLTRAAYEVHQKVSRER